MKKEYVKPVVEFIELRVEEGLAACGLRGSPVPNSCSGSYEAS